MAHTSDSPFQVGDRVMVTDRSDPISLPSEIQNGTICNVSRVFSFHSGYNGWHIGIQVADSPSYTESDVIDRQLKLIRRRKPGEIMDGDLIYDNKRMESFEYKKRRHTTRVAENPERFAVVEDKEENNEEDEEEG